MTFNLNPFGPTDRPDNSFLIVIEGVIGVGKTSLAKLLADRLGGVLLLEQYEQNPFLQHFYQDPARWALHTQLSFILSRFRQQKQFFQQEREGQLVVADYSFIKDYLFAHMNLTGAELSLYDSLFDLMYPSIPRPDLVVYLKSDPDKVLQNIETRGRPFEREIDRDYILALSDAYEEHFSAYNEIALLSIDVTTDFVRDGRNFEKILSQIRDLLPQVM